MLTSSRRGAWAQKSAQRAAQAIAFSGEGRRHSEEQWVGLLLLWLLPLRWEGTRGPRGARVSRGRGYRLYAKEPLSPKKNYRGGPRDLAERSTQSLLEDASGG